MKRRHFIGATAAAGASSLTAGCRVEKVQQEPHKPPATDNGRLAGLTLAELREQYRYDLMDDFIPFIDKHVIDHEYGGFMCNTDRRGNNITTNKSTWYEGRGIWVYSYLYNNIEKNPAFFEVARKSVEFILPHRPDSDTLWPGSYDREGKVLNPKGDVYGGLFVANGLAEYAKACGDDSYWDIAKDTLMRHMRIYDRPVYEYKVTYFRPDPPELPGPRVLGHWMVILRLATQMLQHRDDPEVASIADRCIEAILDRHYNPDFGLMNEALAHDFSRPGNGYDQFSYTGHAIETMWMVFFEAERRRDKKLYERTIDVFKRHVEVSWDDVYGGAFRALYNVDENDWALDKVLWLQEEVLIGTLFMAEHTGDAWAREWFSKMFTYVQDKFPLRQYGYPIWILSGDRKVTFVEKYARVGNFHHPRHLMLNLKALDRIIERNGRISGLF